MLVLTSEELHKIIDACNNPRDRAIIMLMADSGIWRVEATALNWSDLNLEKGLCCIRSGKGGKSRFTAIGPSTRKAVLEYRQTLSYTLKHDPLFQAKIGRPTFYASVFFYLLFTSLNSINQPQRKTTPPPAHHWTQPADTAHLPEPK